ncbi:MAG: ABC transporter permease subunit [Candidatus Lindowbacteria bacterium]|nr:ABC transporter permease subunit [Candidatus Lindowbacteria bacterium]
MRAETKNEQAAPAVSPAKGEKKAKRSVLIADRIADYVITVGGILVIVAVLAIMVFLIQQTLPLFKAGKVTSRHDYTVDAASDSVVAMAMDEYKTFAFMLSRNGEVSVVHAKTGAPFASPAVDLRGKEITSSATALDRSGMALGFADGTVRFAEVSFPSTVITARDLPEGLRELDGRDLTDGSDVYSKAPGAQYRKIVVEVRMEEPLSVSESRKPIVALDYQVSGEAERQTKAFVAMDSSRAATPNIASSALNLLTGEVHTTVEQASLPPIPETVEIRALALTPGADTVLVAGKDGVVYRFNTSDLSGPVLAETTRVLSEGVDLTAFRFLLGGQSLLVGGSDGSLSTFFLLDRDAANTTDGRMLVRAREFERAGSPVVELDPSPQGKSFAVAEALAVPAGFAGMAAVLLVFAAFWTAHHPLVEVTVLESLDRSGSDYGRVRLWEFSVPHPETTFSALFRKVWYEGHPAPTYTWQSSAATDEYESKFSLVPLIFGTIKAAFYSLLFAIPIAILAAIYTSEFVHYRVRSVMKPAMEMMASLPSVVLGFVAALVLAPIVETWIAAVLLAFAVIPLALMIAAYLWQLLPLRIAVRLQGIPRFCFIVVTVIAGIYCALAAGPVFEKLFFAGDFKSWLNGTRGSAQPFLFLLLMPVSFIAVGFLVSRYWGRRLSSAMKRLGHISAALIDIVRWILTLAAAVVCSYVASLALDSLGLDARGNVVDTYVQRNTLVVGFAMGFAVIPIIYTIAEDALNSVPEHLRAASLACGATPWQTAIHVVLPTAISGVFSAIMIGMGRAVGETMIVVMSAGNTPIIDVNVFNGLRALSATIAVELPEAVKDGTLYRILFLAGLVLFSMTFVINTVAELVRIRFRKRTMQL